MVVFFHVQGGPFLYLFSAINIWHVF